MGYRHPYNGIKLVRYGSISFGNVITQMEETKHTRDKLMMVIVCVCGGGIYLSNFLT